MRRILTALSLLLIVLTILLVWVFQGTQPSGKERAGNLQLPSVSSTGTDLDRGQRPARITPAPAGSRGAGKPEKRDRPADPVVPPYDWEEKPSLQLHGWVIDPSGQPVAGAGVLLRSGASVLNADPLKAEQIARERALGRVRLEPPGIVAEAQTDAYGYYSIAIGGLPLGVYQAVARQEGFSPQIKDWTWRAESTELNFRLGAGDWITGWVHDSVGKPLVEATVEVLSEINEQPGDWSGTRRLIDRVRSGPGGFFQLNVYPGSFKLRAQAEGFAPVSLERVPAGSEGVELILASGRSLSGQVINQENEPIPGVEVALYLGEGYKNWGRRPISLLQSAFSTPRGRRKSDENGEFRFDELPADYFNLLAQKPGYRLTLEGGQLSEEAQNTFVEVKLSVGSFLSGRVSDARQRPVAGALVVISQGRLTENKSRQASAARQERLIREGRSDEIELLREYLARRRQERPHEPISLYRASAAVETDQQGRFHFDSLEEKIYDLSVVADDLLPSRVENVDLRQGTRQVEIVLESGVRLEGRVISSLTHQPIAGVQLSLRRRELRRAFKTEQDGSYHFSGLLPGELGPLNLEAEGYSLKILEGLELAGQPATQTLDIQLDPAAVVSGTVLDARGEPVPEAWVRIRPVAKVQEDPDGPEGDWDRGYRQRLQRAVKLSVQSDAIGRFKLTNVDPGSAVQIFVEHPEFKMLSTVPPPVASGERMEGLELWLERGGRLTVRVLSPEGTPVQAGRVRLSRQAPGLEVQEDQIGAVSDQTTNAYGEALFAGIEGGNYLLITGGQGYQPSRSSVFVAKDQDSRITVTLLPENIIAGGTP